jgi:hypothetical protein
MFNTIKEYVCEKLLTDEQKYISNGKTYNDRLDRYVEVTKAERPAARPVTLHISDGKEYTETKKALAVENLRDISTYTKICDSYLDSLNKKEVDHEKAVDELELIINYCCLAMEATVILCDSSVGEAPTHLINELCEGEQDNLSRLRKIYDIEKLINYYLIGQFACYRGELLLVLLLGVLHKLVLCLRGAINQFLYHKNHPSAYQKPIWLRKSEIDKMVKKLVANLRSYQYGIEEYPIKLLKMLMPQFGNLLKEAAAQLYGEQDRLESLAETEKGSAKE